MTRYLALAAAPLLLVACNQNEPTETELPTEAGETVPELPIGETAVDSAEALEATTPEAESAEPVPEEFADEVDQTG